MTDERRKLDGNVDTWNRSIVIVVCLSIFRPRVDHRCKALQQIEVGVLVDFSFRFADHRLTKQVQRKCEPLLSKCGDRCQDFTDVRARDKPTGHSSGVASRVMGQRSGEHGIG